MKLSKKSKEIEENVDKINTDDKVQSVTEKSYIRTKEEFLKSRFEKILIN